MFSGECTEAATSVMWSVLEYVRDLFYSLICQFQKQKSALSVPRFPSRPQRYDRPPVTQHDTNGDALWEVERILAVKNEGRGNSLRCLVQWKGYPAEENSWEPLSNIIGAPDALADFESNKSASP
jgi:hypothetical protein